ncbi:uncharacterized protein BT62DRAFT_987876 [Guyanagaster necrorhizus]|uniref:RING-type E3 ubiquitin transferase n=1 Tax=Guyanagaster necrorhizus TaxID=856835 RepID=A0A9P8AS21_9AGAR|nr:uncharacterized protein BT62DRAFT_987876 [Guyanagaster necrorhizus MCA 3950]KAG7444427.1 hypothetical protein BT62DRAFT_987876 [Guyanagaster necrorhizus MCA 3950]
MDDPLRDEEAGVPPQQPRRRSFSSAIILMVMLFLLTSHNGDEFLARHQYQNALQSLTYQLSNFTAWMNGTETNFTVPDREPSLTSLLHEFIPVRLPLDPLYSSYYSNVTGFIRGSSAFFNITPSFLSTVSYSWKEAAESFIAQVNETEVVERAGIWNWTASSRVSFSVSEKKQPHTLAVDLVLINGRIELTDENTKEDLKFDFEGVHFMPNGSIYGFAEPSGRNIDIRLLPSLVPENQKNETARFVEPELASKLKKLKNLIDAGVIEHEPTPQHETSTCPFALYAQMDPVSISEREMQQLEEEMQHPKGLPTVSPPKLSVSGILISKECGIMFEIRETEGLRSRTFFRKVTTYAGSATVIYFILLFVLARQMERSRTPSGISRVSRWTFFTQSTIDSVSFAGHITFAIIAEGRPSLSLTAPAFLACTMFVYEAQFSVLIHQIQMPEDIVDPVPAPTTAITQERTGNVPPPVVPPNPATTAAAPSLSFWAFAIQHLRSDPGARLWITMFFFLTFIVRVILSPTLSLMFVALTYSFIWLPQIIRSVRRGRSSGFSKEYVIATTGCRLSLGMYFLACPKNVLDVDPRSWACYLAAFVCLQALIVILQDELGPAFFLPAKYAAVKAYDYHPVLPLPDPEAPEQSLGDCVICLDAILIESPLLRKRKSIDEKHDDWDTRSTANKRKIAKGIDASGILNAVQAGVGNAVARKNYSLAPCHHLFHTECLEKWLAIKNICPQCRRPLPPL